MTLWARRSAHDRKVASSISVRGSLFGRGSALVTLTELLDLRHLARGDSLISFNLHNQTIKYQSA